MMTETVKYDARVLADRIEALLGHLRVMIDHGDSKRVGALAGQIEVAVRGLDATDGGPPASKSPSSLRPEQQARRVDPTAYALHVVLDEARAERETASLAHAVASASEYDEALRLSVAASGAVDVALQALTSYVVHGFYQPREIAEAEDDPLHERCRVARNAVARRVADVFASTGRPS